VADTQTLRVEVAQPPKREPAPRTQQPQPLTIPGKPAAISAANAATIVGTTAATVGGPVGWVVGGAVAAGGALAARHALRKRTSKGGANSTAGGDRIGPSAGAGSSGSARRSSARSGHSTTGASAGRAVPGVGQPGRRAGNPGPKGGAWESMRRDAKGRAASAIRASRGPMGSTGGAGVPGGGRSATPKSGGSRGGKPSGSRMFGSVLGGRRTTPAGSGGTGAGIRPGSGGPTSRAARAAGHSAMKGAKAARRGARKVAKLAAKAAKKRSARAKSRRQNGTSAGANQPCHVSMPRKTGSTVARPGGAKPAATQRPSAPPEIKPRPAGQQRKDQPVATGNGAPRKGQQQGASLMWQAANKFHDTCAAYKPRGMLEVRAEAWEMAATLTELANGMYARAQANTRESLDPSLSTLYARLADQVSAAAAAAQTLGPGFDAMHRQLVENLLKSPNPAGWDSSNNRA
jgi:hypothetical protein